MAFQQLDDIFKSVLKWEKDFDAFYDMMEDYLKSSSARHVAEALQKRHDHVLEALESVDVKSYKNIEFVKFVPEYHGEDDFQLDTQISAEELINKILNHEEKRLEYFHKLKDVVVFDKSKELFDMLIQLKLQQAKEIKELAESYPLAYD